MTCAQMGGPADCDVMITGNDMAEMGKNGMAHVEAAHPELAAKLKAMSPEDTAKWMADTQPKFDAAPDMM